MEGGAVVAEFREVHPGARIAILLLLLIVLTLGGVIWFDYLGVINARSLLAPVYRLVGIQRQFEVAGADDPNLLERERLEKQTAALDLRAQDLDAREASLNAREKELAQLASDLKDQKAAEDAREKAFNESVQAFENRRVNLVKTSTYLTSMPAKSAVEILQKMEDQDIIDLFRTTDDQAAVTGIDSPVPYWLSQMPADRAATLERKMAR
jgi:flagellar protein FlbB